MQHSFIFALGNIIIQKQLDLKFLVWMFTSRENSRKEFMTKRTKLPMRPYKEAPIVS